MNPNNKYILPIFLITLFVTASFVYYTQRNSPTDFQRNSNNNEIIWSKNYKLNWSDFRGLPDKNSSYKAVTTSTLQTKAITNNNEKIEYDIIAIFQKNKSWTKSDGLDLLAHEQLHFDMAELVLRKMRKKILEHKFESIDGVNKMVNSALDEATKERSELGKQYDNETEHGVNKENQKKWQKKIEAELDLFKQYSSARVTITK